MTTYRAYRLDRQRHILKGEWLEARDDAEAATRSVVHLAVGLLGAAVPGDAVAAADRTYHLVDGLALHAALWPQRYPPEHQRAVLRGVLDGLLAG